MDINFHAECKECCDDVNKDYQNSQSDRDRSVPNYSYDNHGLAKMTLKVILCFKGNRDPEKQDQGDKSANHSDRAETRN